MRVIRVSRNRVSVRALVEAVRVLREGGVVAFPTETAYGLAADPGNAAAVRAIFAIKGRPRNRSLPLVAADAAQVSRVVVLPRSLTMLADRYWPGPLTIVARVRSAPSADTRPRTVLRYAARRGTIAVRVPGSVWARALPRAFGGPVTSTSANPSGTGERHSGAAVRAAFRVARLSHASGHMPAGSAQRAPDLLLDAGRLPLRPPSTIVALRRGRLNVLRAGSINIVHFMKKNKRSNL